MYTTVSEGYDSGNFYQGIKLACGNWSVGHKNNGCLLSLRAHVYIITKTTRWVVVKNSASPKRPYFFISFLFLMTTPTSNPKGKGGGGMVYMHIHFLIGTCPHLAQKRGHVPEMPPLDASMGIPFGMG